MGGQVTQTDEGGNEQRGEQHTTHRFSQPPPPEIEGHMAVVREQIEVADCEVLSREGDGDHKQSGDGMHELGEKHPKARNSLGPSVNSCE